MIPVQLFDASGIDLVGANVLCAMGENPGDISWDSSICEGAYATYVLHSSVDGVFRGIANSVAIRPHMYRSVIYKQPGESVEAFDGANKALGIEFLRFDGEAEMNGFLSSIGNHIWAEIE